MCVQSRRIAVTVQENNCFFESSAKVNVPDSLPWTHFGRLGIPSLGLWALVLPPLLWLWCLLDFPYPLPGINPLISLVLKLLPMYHFLPFQTEFLEIFYLLMPSRILPGLVWLVTKSAFFTADTYVHPSKDYWVNIFFMCCPAILYHADLAEL